MMRKAANRVNSLIKRTSELTLTRTLCRLTNPQNSPPPKQQQSKKRYYTSKEAYLLYNKLSTLNENHSVEPILNQWLLTQGNSLKQRDIFVSIDYLRHFRKYEHALQLLEWTEKRGLLRLSNREYAKCIDLVRKSRGVEAAEKYFTDLPNSAKNKSTYGALLHCFCCEEMTEKAMMLFGKMKELNFPINSFDYCSLMSLHLRLGQLEKVPLLHEEIKQKGIKPHLFHYKLLINSYASLKDVKSVEGVMEEIKMIKGITPDWAFYSNVAAIYVAAGYHEKAELTLKEIEISKLNDPKAFHFLLSIYASMGKVEEVNRVWQSLKSAFPKTSNLSYLTMLQTLSRLEYMGGLKRCFDEWELHCSSYDIRLANVLIKAYLKRNMTEEANSLLSHLLEKRYELNFRTYALFTEFYLMTHSMDLALKFMGLGTPYLRKSEREMYKKKVHEFLKYFEEERDVCGAKELCNILKQVDFLDLEVYASLLCNNIPFERKERQAPQIMRGNGVEIISESETT